MPRLSILSLLFPALTGAGDVSSIKECAAWAHELAAKRRQLAELTAALPERGLSTADACVAQVLCVKLSVFEKPTAPGLE